MMILYIPVIHLTMTMYQAMTNCDHKKKVMSSKTVTIMKSCQPLLSRHKASIGQTFYNLLFTHHPDLRGVFNMSHQRPCQDGAPGPQVCMTRGEVSTLAC